MKTVKITLALIVLAAIVSAAFYGFMSLSKIDDIQLPKNQFTKKIEVKIDLLKKMPESSFCEKFYNEIKYYIEDDYANNRLGNTQSENNQWKKNLSSNLYAAYTDKFIKQAFYVFNGSEWEDKKINFIRAEYKALQNDGKKSNLLEKNSITDKKLNDINNLFIKYDEIVGFIKSCKSYSFSNFDDFNIPFPISVVQKKILRSDDYLKNNLENVYVKNCKRLEKTLSDVPQILFNSHINYLDNKINHLSGRYVKYSNQLDYSNAIYKPLLNEINQLDNGIYNIVNFETEYSKLLIKLKREGDTAYIYF